MSTKPVGTPTLSEMETHEALWHLQDEARNKLEVSLEILLRTVKAVKDGFRRSHYLAEHLYELARTQRGAMMAMQYDPYSYNGLLDRLSQIERSIAEVGVSAKSLKLPDNFEGRLATLRTTLRVLQQEIKDSPPYKVYRRT